MRYPVTVHQSRWLQSDGPELRGRKWCQLSGLITVPLLTPSRAVGRRCATLTLGGNGAFPLDTESVSRARVQSKQCGMEIAPIQDRVSTVAVTRPAQFSLDELFLGVRESCARRNVQRIQQNFGYRERKTGRMVRSCLSLAYRERVDE